jgi:hypothetical protein
VTDQRVRCHGGARLRVAAGHVERDLVRHRHAMREPRRSSLPGSLPPWLFACVCRTSAAMAGRNPWEYCVSGNTLTSTAPTVPEKTSS